MINPYNRAVELERNAWVEAIETAMIIGSGRGGMPALLESQIKKLSSIIAKMVKDITTLSSVCSACLMVCLYGFVFILFHTYIFSSQILKKPLFCHSLHSL